MKIKIDLHELWNQVHRVSDDVVDIRLKIGSEWVPPEIQKLRERLKTTGINIKLNDVTTTGGLLSYRGQHVLLYIPDHGMNIEDTLREPGIGKKFHLAECRTIKHMRDINRYARYVATTNTSGLFRIVGIDQSKRKSRAKQNYTFAKIVYANLTTKEPNIVLTALALLISILKSFLNSIPQFLSTLALYRKSQLT